METMLRMKILSGGFIAVCLMLLCGGTPVRAEDGYELWLRYTPQTQAAQRALRAAVTGVVAPADVSPTIQAALAELDRGFAGMTGSVLPRRRMLQRGSLLLGTPANSPLIAGLNLPLERAGAEGYVLREVQQHNKRVIVIAANSNVGVLYGCFALLAHVQAGRSLAALDVISAPRIRLRMLNHWDNLDRHVERGYAGESLWDWWKLPDIVDARYVDYARANASVGINATVLNNVNAVAAILTPEYIAKARALAAVFRPYGIRIFLSVRFTSPMELGGLKTADPLDPAVREWWRGKADEIYRQIPDFGGFLVKANSEGQPGPMDYGRTHADGANALAAALAPHGGVVLWRAFVYSANDATDRAMQAYNQLHALDGQFADNVALQVKNGPIDFQPREPFHPLFGAMPATSTGVELQITKEYLGFATHLAYLGTLYEEVLQTDTHARGTGSTVARVVDGSLFGKALTVIAGAANTGTDRNWCGSQFDQANWYVYGRMAWDPAASAKSVAADWVRLTFSTDPDAVAAIVNMMMTSREAVVDYMTPLGLTHQMATGHHYGPGPWVSELSRPEWNPVYYHRADSSGIGFDRTATGSNAVALYAAPVAAAFSDLNTIPLEYLLWFHHVSWDRRLSSGRTTWAELLYRHDRGVAAVKTMAEDWAQLAGKIDTARHAEVARYLGVQLREAQWWRDASIAYWLSVSGRALPPGVAPPPQSLSYYRGLQFPYAPGR
jgi:alpha-glucuronidase